jgi:leader peptidase (prepilin peptidase)/N-methyltransferase
MAYYMQGLVVFALGAAVGSFLNVVRYRLPRHMGLVSGRSRCPGCNHTISWYDNIPVLSFFILRRRCRWCGWRIPWIYFVIEVSTGIGFLLVWRALPVSEVAPYWVFVSIVVACAGIDYDLRVIPDRLTLPGLIAGLVFALTVLRDAPVENALVDALLGVAAGGGSLLLISLLYKIARGVEGMGGGDIKFMAMVGVFLGYKLALLTIFTASVAGGIIGLFLMRRSPEGMKTTVPFGVFLSPAAVFSLIWGERLLSVYAGLIR